MRLAVAMRCAPAIRRALAARRAMVVASAAAAAIAGACTQVSSDPNAVVAIAFDALPFPAIVVGDTLRDEAGVPQTLNATAFNADGNIIEGAKLDFLSLDAGGTVSPDGFVISEPSSATQFRLIAAAGALQSRPLTLIITPRPDSMAQQGTVDTLRYNLTGESQNNSQPVTVRLLNTDNDPPVPARGWIVHYSLERNGAPIPNATSDFAWLIDDSNRRSDVDTATADGSVSRRLHIAFPAGGPLNPLLDSVTVIATATHRGLPLAGSPIRVTIYIKPQGP